MSPPWILSGHGIDPLISPVHRKVAGGSFSQAPIQLFDFEYIREPSALLGLFRMRFTTQARLMIYDDAWVETDVENEPDIGIRMWHEDTGAVDPSPWDWRCREILEVGGVTTGWTGSSPNVGQWYGGGSVLQWSNTPSGIGYIIAVWEIRDAATLAIVAEATIKLGTNA